MNLLSRLGARAFPRRFVSASVADHLSGVYAHANPQALEAAVNELLPRLRAMSASEMRALIQRDREEDEESILSIVDGTAHVAVFGCIVRGDASCLRYFGFAATGTDEIREAIDTALGDASVERIQLNVDSPGGVANGIHELAQHIRAAGASKPILASVDGMCASAAYWLASQANEIVATPSSAVGSIGVYCVYHDASAAMEQRGVKVHVIRSAEHKGVGEHGAPISDEQIAPIQAFCDDLAALFAADVLEARGLDAAALGDGECWIASKALERGLLTAISGASGSAQTATDDGVSSAAEDSMPHATATRPRALTEEEQQKMDELEARVAELEARVAELEEENRVLREENDKLKEEKETESAKASAAMEALATYSAAQKASVIDRAVSAGRVAPAMRGAVEKMAQAYATAEALEADLSKWPVVTAPRPAGASMPEPSVESAVSAADRARLASLLSVDPGLVDRAIASAGVNSKGRVVDADGRELAKV